MRTSPLPTGYSFGRKQLLCLCGTESAAHIVSGGIEFAALHGTEPATRVV